MNECKEVLSNIETLEAVLYKEREAMQTNIKKTKSVTCESHIVTESKRAKAELKQEACYRDTAIFLNYTHEAQTEALNIRQVKDITPQVYDYLCYILKKREKAFVSRMGKDCLVDIDILACLADAIILYCNKIPHDDFIVTLYKTTLKLFYKEVKQNKAYNALTSAIIQKGNSRLHSRKVKYS